MTNEQYYWYRRQQLLRAYMNRQTIAAGYAQSRKFNDEDYILETSVNMTSELYDRADERYNDIPLPDAGCSAVRIGNFHGRNLDYWYNEFPEYVVRTPKTDEFKATLGVALFQ